MVRDPKRAKNDQNRRENPLSNWGVPFLTGAPRLVSTTVAPRAQSIETCRHLDLSVALGSCHASFQPISGGPLRNSKTMRKIGKTFAAALAGSVIAFAANAQEISQTSAVEATGAVWNGLYVGGLLGYADADNAWTLVDNPDPGVCDRCGTELANFGADGFTGGAEVGFDYRAGNIVLGLEADILFMDISGQGEWTVKKTQTRNITNEIEWIATVGPRLGLVADQNVLLYLEGGYAAISQSYSHLSGNGKIFEGSGTDGGWFFGGGMELALNSNWLVKFEYDALSFDNEVSMSGDEPNPVVFDLDQQIQVVKLGLKYQF
jgi:outer membrane immunogenic protein